MLMTAPTCRHREIVVNSDKIAPDLASQRGVDLAANEGEIQFSEEKFQSYECPTARQRDFNSPQVAAMGTHCPVRIHRTVFSTRTRTKKLLASLSSLPRDRAEDWPA